MSQLYECRQQLDEALADKTRLETDVARWSEESTETAARLHAIQVSYSHLVFSLH